MDANDSILRERLRLTVTGVVQGVGFRPFVYGLAQSCGLDGFVGNDSRGVFIEVEGVPEALAAFHARLIAERPPLAHIERVSVEPLPPTGLTGFTIVQSRVQPAANTLVSPDICICDDCLRELFDPADRRYRYPFINCTNCGPRFTIIRDIPYDRPLTTMAGFRMCAACQAEYDDPLNRRFHAQPNACPACGPQVWFEWARGERARPSRSSALAAARQALLGGAIVAVKGLGGFHLACDATNDMALRTLRARKGRVDKPFAIMVRDLAALRTCAQLSPQEEALLTGRERPIVLLRKRPGGPLSELVAPGNAYVGAMLPYTPLHYLLLEDMPPLVMTSGNYSDEPIVKDNDEARARLGGLADAFLFHDREIHVHCDDSVVRVVMGRELPVRRSRGYAPFPVKLPFALRPTLAVGGELKATFCLAKGDYAFMSQHIGDMENLETLTAFEGAVKHFEAIFRVRPERIVADLHPRYLSARWAAERAADDPRRQTQPAGSTQSVTSDDELQPASAQIVRVQHHHAHIAAVMAENGLDGSRPVIGFSFDGTGYGTDGAVWGGEVLVADYSGFKRVAHLKYVPLPGGDVAVIRPYRAALAHLWAAGLPWDEALAPVRACPAIERGLIRRQLETGLNAALTSSMGRLFDAVAALAGVRQTVTYEAQAALEFEALVDPAVTDSYEFGLPNELDTDEPGLIDVAPVIRAVAEDVQRGLPVEIIAARFHNGVAGLIVRLSLMLQEQTRLNQVALSGGVFQNVTLLERAVAGLQQAGFAVFTHRLVPPNDGGLALGQAVIGGARQGPDHEYGGSDV